MDAVFFPNVAFAAVFVLGLAGGLAWLAWVDWHTLTIPKPIVLGILAGGVVANVGRGGWLAATGRPVWALGEVGMVGGAADGLLFAAAGFLAGFGFFLVLWIFNVVGGGDVKLVAAVGAWLGPWYVFGAVLFAALALPLLAVVAIAVRVLFGKPRSPQPVAPLPGRSDVRRPLTSYAIAFGLGTAAILALLVVSDAQKVAAVGRPA